MRFVPKIKRFKKLYNFKLQLRERKNFFYDLFYLIKNITPLSFVINFYKNYYKKKKINQNIDSKEYYLSSKFDDPDWFFMKMPLFINYFKNRKDQIRDILEIGSWEGRSSVFFLNFFKKSKLHCVDTWLGSIEQFKGTQSIENEHNKNKMSKVEENFDYNLKLFTERYKKNKITSDEYFNKNSFFYDLIFIDGLHYFDQVIRDAENSVNFLKQNSYLLFDDYTYRWSGYKSGKNVLNAVNHFLTIYKDQFEIIYISEQVLLKKIVSTKPKGKFRQNNV